MGELELVPMVVEERNLTRYSSFFVDLVGQLAVLPPLLQRRLCQEGAEVVDETTHLVLSRVQHLAPGFPFIALLDDFETPEEAAAAEASIALVVEEVKRAARRE
jgi:hypothetical protein